MKTLPELQQTATAADAHSAHLRAALTELTNQVTTLRTRIAAYGLRDDMTLLAADQQRLLLLEKTIANDTPAAAQAQQAARAARTACEKMESEVWALERRLAELCACTANWVRFQLSIATWQAEITLTIQKLQLMGVTPQVTSTPARPPLPEDAALITA